MTHRTTLTLCLALAAGLAACEQEPITVQGERLRPWVDTDNDGIPDNDETQGVYGYVTDPNDPDSDDDGLSDGDELTVTNTNPNFVDSDSDGLSDYDEVVIYGTDPLSVDSDIDGLLDGDEVFGYGTSPSDWDTDGDGVSDGDEVLEHLSDPLDKDSDGDGLYDGQEVGWGSDPNALDSDGDGLTDMEEVERTGTDPALVDTDFDGLTDGQEINEYGTDPLSNDTDRDGLIDGDEVYYGTNYFNFDTDGDGLSDGTEVNDAGSSPLLRDTDNDGLNDFIEYLAGTDPTSIDTDGDLLSDAVELQQTGTDPLSRDTDEDGLEDGYELTESLTDPLLFDTDGDGLPDGYELDTLQTDPLVADTDRDGLDDGTEVLTFESDPLNPDTDGDGLKDGVEVSIYLTQPAVADTDGDGLDDGVEAEVTYTDPLKADTDEDGAVDGVEIDVWGSSPFYPDTDGDGLTDGDEIITWSTDPTLADTDGGGRDDGVEVGRGDDPNNPADDAVCSYLVDDVAVTSEVTYPEQTPRPVWVRFHWEGVFNGSTFEDSTLGSAQLRLELLDSTQQVPVCTITYDLSAASAPHVSRPWTTEGGGTYFQPVELNVGEGNSTCLGYDGRDLRDVIEGIPWGIAHGPLDTLAAELEQSVTDAGGNWGADWAPYVTGAFLRMQDEQLIEIGYAFTYEADCDVVEDPATASPLPAPVDALGDRYVVATGTRLYTVPELRTFAELATIEPYFDPICLTPAVTPTLTAGDGTCDEPLELDLTLVSVGATTTVQTGTLGGDATLPSSACTDDTERDVVYRVIVPPGSGLEVSVDYQGAGRRPSIAYIETGTCDGLVGGCSAPDSGATPACDLLRIDDDEMTSHAAIIVVTEATATDSDYELSFRTF
mgnify:CR=1 FL=1